MNRMLARTFVVLGFAGLAGVGAGCGDGDDGADSGGFASGKPVAGQKKGGTLKVTSNADVDSIDPGQAYFQVSYQAVYATQRPLYSYRPDNTDEPVPDLASAAPVVSPDGRTVTVKIRPNVRFSPPVDRAVTSRDVKYALTRGFFPSVANQYVGTYFGDLEGAQAVSEGKTRDLAGLRTPDDRTLVMRFTTPIGPTAARALVLPASAPVPEEYARPFDAKKKSDYGFNQVATGPYMIRNDARGKVVGYVPGRRIELVRNPSWNGSATGDYRPAYVDRVDWTIGANPTVAGRQVIRGSGMVSGDTVPAPIVKLAATRHKAQIAFSPLGNRYITLNTALAPFDDPDVRKAVAAVVDRNALQLARGGRLTGKIATHFLPPGIPGFEEAGGLEGKGHDFLATPAGDPAVAARYLRKAGFADGRFKGPRISMVGTRDDRGSQIVLENVRKLGFDVNFRNLSQEAMLAACATPANRVHVCANGGWLPDFNDGYAMLFGPFSGKTISPEQSPNWSQLNDPRINAKMDAAARLTDPARRAAAWGEVDDMITATAAAVPTYWDDVPLVQSKDVQGVVARWNAAWDLSFSSLK